MCLNLIILYFIYNSGFFNLACSYFMVKQSSFVEDTVNRVDAKKNEVEEKNDIIIILFVYFIHK